MFKKIIAFFIRLSLVKRYISSYYKKSSNDYPYMYADAVSYWVYYILTGKSDKQLNEDNDQDE